MAKRILDRSDNQKAKVRVPDPIREERLHLLGGGFIGLMKANEEAIL